MTPLVYYRCAKCRIMYDSYAAAEKCEASHLAAVRVRELEYRPGPYPFRVALIFTDGTEREYIADDGIYIGNEVNRAHHQDKGGV